MSNRFWINGAVVGLLAGALTAPLFSQEGDKPAQPPMSAEDAAWMAAAQPGDNHKLLEPLVGSWSVTTKMFEGETPVEGTGTSESEWMLGGRYVGTHYNGNMMGMPFEGHGVMGYDNVKKKFVSGWVDNMSTGIFVEEGEYDPSTKSFTLLSEMPTPTGGKLKSRSVTVIDSNDKHTMTFYHTEADGKEKKAMELVFTRTGGGKGKEGMSGK